mmetsp:Transcript_14388/g.19243  ORF Transcript_14388/g.19243 Transcript_14388/m.19243 type:complete len:589 (-) Transcript_14388:1707-3473(-)
MALQNHRNMIGISLNHIMTPDQMMLLYKKNGYKIDNVFQGIGFSGPEALSRIPRLKELDEETRIDCYVALFKEFAGFINNGTVSRCFPAKYDYECVPKPLHIQTILTKKMAGREYLGVKARSVVMGNREIEGLHYFDKDIHRNTVSDDAEVLFYIFCCSHKVIAVFRDVTGAYLLVVDNGNLYVYPLYGMTGLEPKEVLRKLGMIYGEKRANAAWHDRLQDEFRQEGFKSVDVTEPNLLQREPQGNDKDRCLAMTYVDNIAIASSLGDKSEVLKKAEKNLAARLPLTKEPETEWNGCQLTWQEGVLSKSVSAYIERLVEHYKKYYNFGSNKIKLPMSPALEKNLEFDTSDLLGDRFNFRELMGQLNWPIVKAFPLQKFWHQSLSRFMTKAREKHLKGAFQLLNYLLNNRFRPWTIKGANLKDTRITVYCDSSNCDEKLTGHTTTCAMLFVDQSLVFVYCKKKQKVQPESMMNECRAIYESWRRSVRIKRMLHNMGFHVRRKLMVISDSDSGLHALTQPYITDKAKYLPPKNLKIRQLYGNNEIGLGGVSSENNYADLDTKSDHTFERFNRLTEEIMDARVNIEPEVVW